MRPPATPIAPEDKVPTFQKIMFSAGVNTDYVSTNLMMGVLWMPFFNIGLGMQPLTLGIILMIFRAWDAVTDPLVGNISDNARTRWGRRRPFMFVGAITTALLYPLFWYMPEIWGPTGRAVYLTVVGMVFFASFTTWSMPYYGLQLELTPNYDERTRLAAWMTLFGKLSLLAGSWGLPIVLWLGSVALAEPDALIGHGAWVDRLSQWAQPWLNTLSGANADDQPIIVGMRVACWLIALCIMVLGLLPPLFVKERYYKVEASRQTKDSFLQGLKESLSCKPLWPLIFISFFLVLGGSSVGALGQYVNFYYVNHGDLAAAAVIAGWKGTVVVVAGIASVPFFIWLGEKWDKRSVVMTMIGSSMFGHLLNYFLMTPAHPYWQIIPGVFESSTVAAVWLFLPSMKADVADWDELQTNRRREGGINAFYSWFIKASLTCSMGVGGLVLQLTGFDAKLDAQPQEALQRMFWIYLVLPIVIWGIALAFASAYPITRQRAGDIRAQLEARRGRI